MKIHLVNQQKDLKLDRILWRKAIKEVAALQNETFEEVTLHFVTQDAICQLHDDYFNDPSPTDCISFPIDGPDEPHRILGDVFICPKTAIDYTHKNGGDPEREALLYGIHGMLHLFGYDDMTPEERQKMRRYEKKHLKNLEAKGIIQAL
ncbi:MAG: rRNA maturation RNase YbeY [Chlamydiia bacterium]|nr:rRNA maturation RNase YbeY [Chlamydiia bacterium]